MENFEDFIEESLESEESIEETIEESEESIEDSTQEAMETLQVVSSDFMSEELLAEVHYTNSLLTIILYVLIIWFIRKIILSIRGYFFGD